MSGFTEIMQAIKAGDPQAEGRFLVMVYDELRRLAAAQLANERPGHTLQATALVHEADRARRKQSLKRGGGFVQQELYDIPGLDEPSEDLLALDGRVTS